jgi:predicted transcriptional regulator
VRAVSAKVLKGKVITRAALPEGAKLTVFVHEPDTGVKLDGEDEAAIAAGAAEIRAGRYVSATELRSFLRRK